MQGRSLLHVAAVISSTKSWSSTYVKSVTKLHQPNVCLAAMASWGYKRASPCPKTLGGMGLSRLHSESLEFLLLVIKFIDDQQLAGFGLQKNVFPSFAFSPFVA